MHRAIEEKLAAHFNRVAAPTAGRQAGAGAI